MAPESVRADDRPVIGLIENVQLLGLDMVFVAKIDTGAKTSAINAFDVNTFKRGGKSWVRFKIQSKVGETAELELPVVRFVKIFRAGAEDDVRPVVKLPICIGTLAQEAQFTLKYRKGMGYCMLIGRRVLDNNFLVDSSAEFIAAPNCSPSNIGDKIMPLSRIKGDPECFGTGRQ
ncbi:MAG: RimK/LysX family protein [Rhodospirillales bacterium]